MSNDSSGNPNISEGPNVSAWPPVGEVALRKRVIAVHDLAGFMRAAQHHDALAVWAYLDEYYALCAEQVAGAGGRVVKFVGDACLAIFPPDRCVEAVDAMAQLREQVSGLSRRRGFPVGSGATNVHLATIAEGDLGPEGLRRFDVIGEGVNHTFLLGSRMGPGVHVSEPVYRQLPNDRRGPWKKQRPPATYTLC